MEISAKEYKVVYDQGISTVSFEGELALMGMGAYPPIADLLDQALEDVVKQESEYLVIDVSRLNFLNSSGINIISKFVIKVRRLGGIKMLVKGSSSIAWQETSLANLKRLLPDMVVEYM